MSPATASICAVTRSAGKRDRRLDADGVLRRDRGDRAGAVDAERRERLQVGLDAGAAARVAARNCQRCTHTLRSAFMYPNIARHDDDRAPDARFRTAEQIGAVLFVTILTAIAAQISIPLPFTPVPFTFQPMVVLLGAAALGPRLGMASQILYLALGIAGLPVFAASPVLPQGAARLLGPTGGYLMAYPFAAFAAGWLARARIRSPLPHRRRLDGVRPRDRVRRRRALADDRVAGRRSACPARSPPASCRSSSPIC